MKTDEHYMKIALELAKKGYGSVNPNPAVGAVIVKNRKVIGYGFHEKYGMPHAERNAISNCFQSPQGSTLYVTLEPCCHHGKTPPCTDAIIESGISRVVIGSRDPNKLVCSKSLQILRENGIEVKEGVLKNECDEINKPFFHYITTGLPYVVMKYAMTLDGKIATRTGKSKWITGTESRNHVHQSRNRYSGIMVGINTVLSDDPMLNCRIKGGKSPVRIICDSNLRLPLSSKIAITAKEIPTYVAAVSNDKEKIDRLLELGIKIINVQNKNGHVDLNDLMGKLGKMEIDSILLEGGAQLNYSALQSNIVNKVQAYISPKIFGGSISKTPVGGEGINEISKAVTGEKHKITALGEDILLEYNLK